MSYDFHNIFKRIPISSYGDITEVCNLAKVHCTHPKFKQSNIYSKVARS